MCYRLAFRSSEARGLEFGYLETTNLRNHRSLPGTRNPTIARTDYQKEH